jgi:hypothetical protein
MRRGRRPSSVPSSCSELLSEPGSGPVLLTRAEPAQVVAATDVSPGGEVTGTGSLAVSGLVARLPSGPGVSWSSRRGRPIYPWPMSAWPFCAPMACAPAVLVDCGVAGVHRLLASVDELADADAVVVVAGMEGALASLVGGISPAPIVAVPVSTGYGAALEGVTALLAMHASCAAGLTVVGIDNGFGAACAVARILP